MNVSEIIDFLKTCDKNDLLHYHMIIQNKSLFIPFEKIEYVHTPDNKRILIVIPAYRTDNSMNVQSAISKLKDCHPEDFLFVVKNQEDSEMFHIISITHFEYTEMLCKTHEKHNILTAYIDSKKELIYN